MEDRRFIIATTTHRGCFAGYVTVETEGKDEIVLEDCCMIIHWGTTKGLWELAADGPTTKTKISSRAPRVEIRSLTAILDVSEKAREAWAKKEA